LAQRYRSPAKGGPKVGDLLQKSPFLARQMIGFCFLTGKKICYNGAMKLTRKESENARKRGLAYEQDMVIEGIHLEADEKAFFEQLDADAINYEDGVKRAKEFARKKIRERQVVPAAE
jgi:hypothetical protein